MISVIRIFSNRIIIWYKASYVSKTTQWFLYFIEMLRLNFVVVVRTMQMLLANTSIKPRIKKKKKSISHLNELHWAHQVHFTQAQNEAITTNFSLVIPKSCWKFVPLVLFCQGLGPVNAWNEWLLTSASVVWGLHSPAGAVNPFWRPCFHRFNDVAVACIYWRWKRETVWKNNDLSFLEEHK